MKNKIKKLIPIKLKRARKIILQKIKSLPYVLMYNYYKKHTELNENKVLFLSSSRDTLSGNFLFIYNELKTRKKNDRYKYRSKNETRNINRGADTGCFLFYSGKGHLGTSFEFHLGHYTAAHFKRQLGVDPIIGGWIYLFLSKSTDSLGNSTAATAIFKASPGRKGSIPDFSTAQKSRPLSIYTFRISAMYGSPTAYSAASPATQDRTIRTGLRLFFVSRPMISAEGISPSRKPKVGCST